MGGGGRQHWLNAAQNEANTYVATVGLLRPAATKMTGGLDSFQLQKLPFVVCAPCLLSCMMWAWQAPELNYTCT